MPPIPEGQLPINEGGEDFVLMDVVGGGCQLNGSMGFYKYGSVSVLHPSKPVVAYSTGSMIIVYDLMSDSKINLVGHTNDVVSLAFTPNGDALVSVDFNRNIDLLDNLDPSNLKSQEPTSNLMLWDW